MYIFLLVLSTSESPHFITLAPLTPYACSSHLQSVTFICTHLFHNLFLFGTPYQTNLWTLLLLLLLRLSYLLTTLIINFILVIKYIVYRVHLTISTMAICVSFANAKSVIEKKFKIFWKILFVKVLVSSKIFVDTPSKVQY